MMGFAPLNPSYGPIAVEEAMSAGEQAVASLAAALIDDISALTPTERKLIARRTPIDPGAVAYARTQILAGADPLGERFCVLRSAERRRGTGAIYTPRAIVEPMVEWAALAGRQPARIVDPGAGSGRFLAAAARRFPAAQLIAADIDPLAMLMLRANASVLGFADRLDAQLIDYRALDLAPIADATLFIGNPPCVRHHDIAARWKTWFAATAGRFNLAASKLAGLHVHFFLKTRELARSGDFGAFITAAEWLDVNYGGLVRNLLADGLGGSAIDIIDPKARPFADTQTTGVITCFQVGSRPASLAMRSVAALADLAPLGRGRAVSWRDVAAAPKWSGAHESYIANHRRPWWSVALREAAPILVTYMARRAPVFVQNRAKARHINIAHGLYPREPLTERDLMAIVAHLRRHADTEGGRIYAGGLVKFEPREVERIAIPRLESMSGDAA